MKHFGQTEILITVLNPVIIFILSIPSIKITSSDSFKKVTPPDYVFGIVWTFLFTFVGAAWAFDNSLEADTIAIYVILDLILVSWSYIFFLNKKWSLYMIYLSFLMTFFAFVHGSEQSKYFLVPLLTWLLFAANLDFLEVLNEDSVKFEAVI